MYFDNTMIPWGKKRPFEKLIVAQPVKLSSPFMKPKGPLS